MDINKILRWVVLSGLFVIPFLPLLVNTSGFFPFITGKNFVFRVITEIILASWVILALRDKNYRPKKSFLLYSVLALLVATGLATIFGENPYRSFWSNYERMGGLVSLLHVGGYFIALSSVFKKKIEWFWLANTALIANWLVNIYSVRQLLGLESIHQGGVRLDATLGNSAYLAVYLLFNIFIACYLISQIKGQLWLKIIYGLTALVDIFFLYNTATRGTILGLILGVIAATGFFLLKGEKKTKKVAGIILGVIILVIGSFWLIKGSSFVQNSPVLSRFASISLTETTTQSRFLIWNMSWQGFKEHPVLGWGPENYGLVFSKYYDPAMWRQEPWFDRSHNVFFDWLIDAGLLGLLAYLSIFVSALYYLWRKNKNFGLSGVSLLIGLLAGYFLHNIFVFDNLISYILFFSLIAYIHFVATEKDEEKNSVKEVYTSSKKIDKNNRDLILNTSSVLVIIVLLGGLYYLNYKPYLTSIKLIQAIHPQTNPVDGLEIFKELFALNTFGSGEALEQLIVRTPSVLASAGVSNEVKVQYVKLADEQIKKHMLIYSNDARSNLIFGTYLSNIGRSDEALFFLNKAKELSPKKQNILFELGSAYVNKQDANNTLAVLKNAYDLDPSNSEARKMYALVALMTSQFGLANNLLAPIKNTSSYYNDERFLNIYRQMGNQSAIDEIMKLREAGQKK